MQRLKTGTVIKVDQDAEEQDGVGDQIIDMGLVMILDSRVDTEAVAIQVDMVGEVGEVDTAVVEVALLEVGVDLMVGVEEVAEILAAITTEAAVLVKIA